MNILVSFEVYFSGRGGACTLAWFKGLKVNIHAQF